MNVNMGQAVGIEKGLQAVQGSSFELESTAKLIERSTLQPKILSAIVGAMVNAEYFTTDTFVFDEVTATDSLPAGKQYSGFGATVGKDRARTLRYAIPSFGIHGQVAPKDFANKRIPGTDELMTAGYVLNKINKKMADAWSMFHEQQLMHLLITDTNDAAGGPGIEYDFMEDITGTARVTANIQYSVGGTDHVQQIRAQKNLLVTEMMQSGEVVGDFICLCDTAFFENRLEDEQQEAVGRPLRTELDLLVQEVPGVSMDGTSFKVDNFKGARDGITYILLNSNIGGQEIPAGGALLLPANAKNFIRFGYAPAQDMDNVNKQAKARYGWTKQDPRNGISVWEESNFLAAMVNPRLMRRLGSD